jgi:hypothetical protein
MTASRRENLGIAVSDRSRTARLVIDDKLHWHCPDYPKTKGIMQENRSPLHNPINTKNETKTTYNVSNDSRGNSS